MLNPSIFKYFFVIAAMLKSLFCPGQPDSSRTKYDSLRIVRVHSVKREFQIKEGNFLYKINDKSVDKETYVKFESEDDTIRHCTPCIVESYDIKERLIYKTVQYKNCPIGNVVMYYPNGKIRFIGHYKPNETDDWEDLWKKGKCGIKHGKWVFYNKKGKLKKAEEYLDGKLVRQN